MQGLERVFKKYFVNVFLVLLVCLVAWGLFQSLRILYKGYKAITKNNKEQTGSIYCEGTSGSIRFKGSINTSDSWLYFVTEDGQKVKTSFPCAVIWDKE